MYFPDVVVSRFTEQVDNFPDIVDSIPDLVVEKLCIIVTNAW